MMKNLNHPDRLLVAVKWIFLSRYVLENRKVNKWSDLFIDSVLIILGIESFTVLRSEQDVSVFINHRGEQIVVN